MIANPSLQVVDVHEMLVERGEGWALRHPGCYQVCDQAGTTLVGGGDPAIVWGAYLESDTLFIGRPSIAYRADERRVAVGFPDGLALCYGPNRTRRTSCRESVVLLVCQDRVAPDGSIERTGPRPFTLAITP